MIYEISMYAAKCDNCGKAWKNNEGIMAYSDQSGMEESIMNDEWHTEKGDLVDKHYCPSCWFMDDEDNIQLKPHPPLPKE